LFKALLARFCRAKKVGWRVYGVGEKAEERYREREMVNEGKKNQRQESRKEEGRVAEGG